MINKRLLGLILGLGVLFSACTKEDLSECFSGLRLHYSYVLNKQQTNLFGSNIHSIRIYIFDEQGVLRAIEGGSGAELTDDWVKEIPIAPGKYTIVSWATSDIDFNKSYFEANMIDPATNSYSRGVTIGVTNLETFRIIINHGVAYDYPEDVIPEAHDFGDLFYGHVQQLVEVKNGKITDRDIEMIKNTNTLKVKVTGLQNLPNYRYLTPFALPITQSPLEVYATARNGRFKYDNTIGEWARLIRYEPPYKYLDQNTLEVDIKIVRLDIERHTADPVHLYIKDPVSQKTFADIDVVASIIQAKDKNGNYIIKNQEDLDREDEFPFEINISIDLSIKIYINGWELIYVKPEK